jgi:hypothetical protein
VASLLPSTSLINNQLIQQPEPSGSEAGESRVRNRVRVSLPTRHLARALKGSFTCRKSTTWDRQEFCFAIDLSFCW